MSKPFGVQMKGVADRLLGPSSPFSRQDMTLRRITPGDGPPYDPGPSITTDYPLSGALRDVDQRHIDGTIVQVGDEVAVVQVPDVVPTTADKLLVGSRLMQIVKVGRAVAADTTVAYPIFVRS